MKTLLKIITSLGLFIFTTLWVYAISAPTNVSILSVEETSFTLNWDEVDEALGYLVYYSTVSWDYNFISPDLISETSYTVTGLDAGSTYYASVVSVDMEQNESEYSSEVEVTTGEVVEDFALESIEVVDEGTINAVFNSNIEISDDIVPAFKVSKKDDVLDELDILTVYVDKSFAPNVVSIVFDPLTLPEVGVEYDVIVIDIQDIQWRNIEAWVDATETFFWIEPVLNAAGPEASGDEQNEETSKQSEESNDLEIEGSQAWVNLNEDQVGKSTHSVAEENDQLPDTGPEHIFLFVLSLMLAIVVFMFSMKRS